MIKFLLRAPLLVIAAQGTFFLSDQTGHSFAFGVFYSLCAVLSTAMALEYTPIDGFLDRPINWKKWGWMDDLDRSLS